MISGFQFVTHHIEKIHLENPGVKVNLDVMNLGYFAKYRYEHMDNGWVGEIALAFRRELPGPDKPKCLFEIIITGKFEAQRDEMIPSDEDFVKRLKINGAATLIPLARAVLTATAAMTGRSELYSLPNLNVFELAWREASEAENNQA